MSTAPTLALSPGVPPAVSLPALPLPATSWEGLKIITDINAHHFPPPQFPYLLFLSFPCFQRLSSLHLSSALSSDGRPVASQLLGRSDSCQLGTSPSGSFRGTWHPWCGTPGIGSSASPRHLSALRRAQPLSPLTKGQSSTTPGWSGNREQWIPLS